MMFDCMLLAKHDKSAFNCDFILIGWKHLHNTQRDMYRNLGFNKHSSRTFFWSAAAKDAKYFEPDGLHGTTLLTATVSGTQLCNVCCNLLYVYI